MDVSHNPSPHVAKLKALQAAEKRRKALGGEARKLGGSDVKGISPRELAARVFVPFAPENCS